MENNLSSLNLPGALHWHNQPLACQITDDGSLTIVAGENTTWFNDPAGTYRRDSAPALLFRPPDSHFILSARITVGFSGMFDAGVIQLRAADDRWAKLCFEYSPQQEPMVVTVITRGRSDDCNAAIIAGSTVYLRAAVTPNTVACHYSLDGQFWHFVRYGSLGAHTGLLAGFSAQAPRGQQCAATFNEIHYRPGQIANLRSGE